MSFSRVLMDIAAVTSLEEKTLEQLTMKTQEEVGELAQAVLSFTKAPGCAYKNKTREDVDEEAVDVILCAAATLFRNQVRSHPELEELIYRKIDAWKQKIEMERFK